MTTRYLNILLTVFGIAAGISMLTLIHAHDFQPSPEARPTEAPHWIAPGTDPAAVIKRHAPRG